MQRLLKLKLPRESFLYLLKLSLKLIDLFWVSLSIPTETSSSNWGTSKWSTFGVSCGMLRWIEGFRMLWFFITRVSFEGHRGWTLNLVQSGDRTAFKPSHHWDHHMSEISELLLHIVGFCCWNWWMLFSWFSIHVIGSGKNRTSKRMRSFLGINSWTSCY